MTAFSNWLSNLNFLGILDLFGITNIWIFLLKIAAFLICIIIHECSHGLVAYRLGDPTAKNQGRLTLNPIKHIDKWGGIMFLLSGFRFGWAKPVPIDIRYFKNKKLGMALTALAGPLSNILLAVLSLAVASLLIELKLYFDYILFPLCYLAYLSILLAVFNILPISPLDGSKILFAVLPDRIYYYILKYERYGFFLVLALLYLGLLSKPLGFLQINILTFLARITSFPLGVLYDYGMLW